MVLKLFSAHKTSATMFPEITPLKLPIAIRTEHVVDKHTTFRVLQHGKALSSGKFTVFSPNGYTAADESLDHKGASAEEQHPQALMFVDGKYMSRKERRAFRDASGLPLFDIYHCAMGATWYVEVPGGNGTPIARIMPSYSLKDVLDIQLYNAAANGEEVALHVQGQDIWKLRTNVYLGDKVIMTAKRNDKLAAYLPGRKLEWVVDIAAGMDISLASVIVVVLAANMYDSTLQK